MKHFAPAYKIIKYNLYFNGEPRTAHDIRINLTYYNLEKKHFYKLPGNALILAIKGKLSRFLHLTYYQIIITF